MSPTIRIDDEVFDALKKHAEPFVDTPNSVLRRLLGLGETSSNGRGDVDLDEKEVVQAAGGRRARPQARQRRRRTQSQRQPRAKTGTILPETDYELPMLEIIAEHGGRAPAREVLDELETRLSGKLTEVDHATLGSGDIRWRNRAQFVRLRLIQEGDLVKDSPRGVWELTDQGRRRIADAA
jgi:Mrr N-terminal domain